MKAVLKKWGNSIALRLPASVLKEAGLRENQVVRIVVASGKIVITPTSSTQFPEGRVSRVASLRARAEDVFGDPEKAWKWLNRPNRALAQKTPLEMIDTDASFQSVLTILGRLEHGIYS